MHRSDHGRRAYDVIVSPPSNNELLAMLRMYAQHQAASHEPPIVIIENSHELNPRALRVLCELANLRVRQTCALKLVFVSDRSLHAIMDAPAMEFISRRTTVDFHLRPMSCEEATEYLHTKLSAAGSIIPSFIFPASVCNELWDASGGWPGILDRIALLALSRAESLPVRISNVERPVVPAGTWGAREIVDEQEIEGGPLAAATLFLTKDGKTTKQLRCDKPRLLIGRSEHNDLSIDSRFVSRHHMLLVRHGHSTFLTDLNSTNGTFVNSKRVSNQVLVDNDIITVGHHRLKFCDPNAKQHGTLEGNAFDDTVIMKTLDDMRSLLSQEITSILPSLTENVPTLGSK